MVLKMLKTMLTFFSCLICLIGSYVHAQVIMETVLEILDLPVEVKPTH
jgi:hypothetical protein